MENPSLIIKEVSIFRMPGFPKGLETYKALSAGINIIAGPNGSGKSSTARMIQLIIWPDITDGIQLDSSFKVDTVTWERKIDSKNVLLQRDGITDELNRIPPTEERRRYLLALHDLVLEDDKDLARKILKESIGGYDLDSVQQILGYSDNIKTRAATEFKDFDYAESAYRETLQKQKDVKNDADKLETLYQTKEKAESAEKQGGFYTIVIDYLEAKIKFEQAEKEFNAFPAILAYSTGDEFAVIEELEKEQQALERIAIDSTNEKEANEAVISGLNISADNIEQDLIELDQRVDQLNANEHSANDKNIKIKGCAEKVNSSLKAIDRNLDSAEWESLNLEQTSRLNEFFLTAHSLLSEKQFIEAEIKELRKELVVDAVKTSTLTDAIRALSYWLQEQNNATQGISKTWLFVLAALGILTIIVTYLTGWPGLFGIVAIIITALHASRIKKQTINNIRESDYSKTGLAQPTDWSIPSVINKINQLNDELYNTRLQEQVLQRIATLTAELDPVNARLGEHIRKREEWTEKLKVIPALPEEDLKHYGGLHWFLTRVIEWETYSTELQSVTSEKAELDRQFAEILDRVNLLLAKYDIENAVDAVTANSLFKKLKSDEDRRKSASAEVERQEKILRENSKRTQAVSEKTKKIYEKLEIEDGQKDQLRLLLSQLGAYKIANENKTVTSRLLSEKESLVKHHSLFASKQEEIETLTLDQVTSRATQYKLESETFIATNNEIVRIETNIDREKEGNDLELALLNKDQRLEDLTELYKSNLSSITGKLIVEQLKKETREKNRPKVFKRANEIFNRITKGQYELRLEEKTVPSFIAYDTILKIGQDLNTLSTGTRIQLLISVRLAFIETQEAAIKLPILADELLANSDDLRANAIIEALVEISKGGRQVFYFTAQADEVAKWKNYLDNDGAVEYEIKNLVGKINEAGIQNSQQKIEPLTFYFKAPSPVDNNHEAYGKLLELASFDFISDELEQLHLWHLIDDNDLLHKCLLKGINLWGQLNSFLTTGGSVEGLNDSAHAAMQSKIRFLARFQTLYRQGRPRTITRQILESSGAVSPNYIDQVTAKLYQLNSNPVDLIESLRDGGVSGFRSNKTDDLEQYLIDQGFIDTMEVLQKDEILIQLSAFLSTSNIDPSAAESCINNILSN